MNHFIILHFTDCQSPTSPTGYTVSATTTLEGYTATVTCATGYEDVSGSPDPITCQSDGSWTEPSGCQKKGNLFTLSTKTFLDNQKQRTEITTKNA